MSSVHRYSVNPELAKKIQGAASSGERIRVKVNDALYELIVQGPLDASADDSIWTGYDPDAARQAWDDSAGIFPEIDPEELIARMKEAREQDSESRSKPR